MPRSVKPLKLSLWRNVAIVFFLILVLLGLYSAVTYRQIRHDALRKSADEIAPLVSGDWRGLLAELAVPTIAAALLITTLLVRLITRPIHKFVEGVTAICEGQAGACADAGNTKGLGPLAETFRQVTQTLRQSQEQLEKEVQQRTAELSAINKVLACEVTQRTRAERRQAILLRQVGDINEELTQFAYVVSHDLKAPLRGIRLIAEWLCADYGDRLGEEAREQLDLLQNRVTRMHDLIDGVLQYSRVGRIREDIVPVDLNELIPNIIDAIAPPENIHVTVESDLPVIDCEKTRITQVFQNLLSNAVKYMDKPIGEIRVACTAEGDFWKFAVSDNGPGIEDQHLDRIFRLFQTLAPRDEYESTGVGLTLVKKIVEMYGGLVWVESELGHGSTFFFNLPRTKRETALPEPLAAGAPDDGSIRAAHVSGSDAPLR
jgi:signal transduction histidine kinase